MEKTFNAHSNKVTVMTDGRDTHLLFMLQRPVDKNADGNTQLIIEEQALITIPFVYAKSVAEAIIRNIDDYKKEADAKAKTKASEAKE